VSMSMHLNVCMLLETNQDSTNIPMTRMERDLDFLLFRTSSKVHVDFYVLREQLGVSDFCFVFFVYYE